MERGGDSVSVVSIIVSCQSIRYSSDAYYTFNQHHSQVAAKARMTDGGETLKRSHNEKTFQRDVFFLPFRW